MKICDCCGAEVPVEKHVFRALKYRAGSCVGESKEVCHECDAELRKIEMVVRDFIWNKVEEQEKSFLARVWERLSKKGKTNE